MPKVKTTTISFEEFTDDQFIKPSNHYVKNAMGDFTFFHSRDRATCQQACDEMYGAGQYKVNASKMGKSPESQSAVGRINSKSRAGSRPVK